MASHGIKDRVAIVGMGCTQFREHWDKGLEDLAVEGTHAGLDSAGITLDDVDAWWLGTAQSGMSGVTLAGPLKLQGKPVTSCEASSLPVAPASTASGVCVKSANMSGVHSTSRA